MGRQQQLAAFGRIWAATHLLRMSSAGFRTHPIQLQLALLLLTMVSPARPAVLGCAIATRLLGLAAKMPIMHDSQYLAFQLDCVLLFALLAHTASRRPKMVVEGGPVGIEVGGLTPKSVARRMDRWITPLDAREQQSIVAAAAAPTLRMLGVFYFAAGFWKINTGFLNPEYSCGTVIFLQLLDHLPAAVGDYPPLVHFVTSVAPLATIVVEMSTGVLLLCPRPVFGASLMLALHLMIGITPPPNNIASFGCVTCSRLFFLKPKETTATLHEIMTTPRLAAAAVGLASAAIGITRRHHVEGAPLDAPLVFFSLLCFVLCRTLSRRPCRGALDADSTHVLAQPQAKEELSTPRPAPTQVRVKWWQRCTGWCMVFSMVAYAILFPMLGVMDLGAPNMFSNLRMHGGGNHLILPVALLQRHWHDSANPTGGFGGGIVRVEGTNNLTWLDNMYPGNLIDTLSGAARARLKLANHNLCFFVPMTGRSASLDPSPAAVTSASASASAQAAATKVPYTLHFSELLRLLNEADHRQGGYSISYTRLPGAEGDEAWRAFAGGPSVRITCDGRGKRTCTTTGPNPDVAAATCAEELRLHEARVDTWLMKLRFGKPYPVSTEHLDAFVCSE
jgi:hypothetical protein